MTLRASASWVIVRRSTGEAVLETFDRRLADAVNLERYDVVPILAYLESVNQRIITEGR